MCIRDRLSGGEKSRVALAKTLISESNFLLLDEPTNHLDIRSVNILVQSLQQYAGSFLVVSHDRHFIRQIANKIWYIENKQVKEYPGNYEAFCWWWERKKKENADTPSSPKTQKNPEIKPKKNPSIKTEDAELKRLENKIEILEKEIIEIETVLNQNDIYSDGEVLGEMTSKFEGKKKELDRYMVEWETLGSKKININERE